MAYPLSAYTIISFTYYLAHPFGALHDRLKTNEKVCSIKFILPVLSIFSATGISIMKEFKYLSGRANLQKGISHKWLKITPTQTGN